MLCFVRNGFAIVDIVSPLVSPVDVFCLVSRNEYFTAIYFV